MAIDLLRDKGTPLDKQILSWKGRVREPISKLNDDAFTRVRVILMNGIELESIRFLHSFARMNRDLRVPLAQIRRIDHQQATLINWLLGPDHSPLETTIAYEQVAIEVTASVAQNEPDPYLAQSYRFGMLEDFDHMYRYSALLERLEGKDPNNILQSYTDVLPGRPTIDEHRAPEDDVRNSYDRTTAEFISKLNALTIMAAEQQTWNYYMNIGPLFADPVARMLYAEIAEIEEQHVTQYESLSDPTESWLEKWLLHEATEVYNYYSCVQQESDARVKAIWEQFLDYELGQLAAVRELYKTHERKDPAEILADRMPEPIAFKSQRSFVRSILKKEIDLRARGVDYVTLENESEASRIYRQRVNAGGVPSEIVTQNYLYQPGGELTRADFKLRHGQAAQMPRSEKSNQGART